MDHCQRGTPDVHVSKIGVLAWALGGDMCPQLSRKAQPAARMWHPNLVATYAVGAARERAYLVSKLYDGRSLDTITPLRSGCSIIIAHALDDSYYHSDGHRAIEPHIILLVGRGAMSTLCCLTLVIQTYDDTTTRLGSLESRVICATV